MDATDLDEAQRFLNKMAARIPMAGKVTVEARGDRGASGKV
jgi:hypothetical protein